MLSLVTACEMISCHTQRKEGEFYMSGQRHPHFLVMYQYIYYEVLQFLYVNIFILLNLKNL